MEAPSSFSPQNIPLALAAFAPDAQVPLLNEKYFDGGQCRIYKVDFNDQESWAVRIPLHVQNASHELIIGILQSEILVLQHLEEKGFRWAPRLQASSLTFENSVRYPFLALSWVAGESLSWSLEQPARPTRDKILVQMAGVVKELLECTSQVGRICYALPIYGHLLTDICRRGSHPVL